MFIESYLNIKYLAMNRNFHISKQTQDKVKLAKQFIENKYQGIIKQENESKQNWQKIIKMMDRSNLEPGQKLQIAQKIIQRESIKKRLLRQKDSLKNYQLHQIIGKGAFGQVRLARHLTTNEIVAIKRMEKKKLVGKKQISSAYLERELLMKTNSPFLVRMTSTFQDKKYLYIAMEYISGGDLLHLLIQKDIFTEEQTKFYIAELVLAVEKIHQMNYIHRDIKPDNILIAKDGHIKISDFGLSKYMEIGEKVDRGEQRLTKMASIRKHTEVLQGRNRKFSKVGTPDYISPQILTDECYDHRVDIWSIGVIMFECLFGYPPFSHEDSKQVCHRVMKWNDYLEFPSQIHTSIEAKMLILGMMNDRDQRLSISEIKQHPFFKGFRWDNVLEYRPPHLPVINDQLDTNNFEQFQQNDWRMPENQEGESDEEDNILRHPNRKKRSSSLVSPYLFAGFDYHSVPQANIFEETAKQIEAFQKFRITKSKSPSNKHAASKRLKTEESSPMISNATFRKQKWKTYKQQINLLKKSLKSTKQNTYDDLKDIKKSSTKTQSQARLLKKTIKPK